MATLLFHEWFQDHPFDPSGRHLMKHGGEKPSGSDKPDQYERRKAREHRRANRRHEKRTGETLDEAEAREKAERAEARKAAQEEQAKMAEKMADIVTDKVDEVGEENADVLIARIEGKREAGELNEEQLENLNEALAELESIHSKRENNEITADAYRTLIQHFTASHLDLVLTSDEITRLQAMVDSRLEAYEANAARVDAARETRNLSELEELALAFVTEAGSGDHPNVDAERLKAGAIYNVDFHNPDGSLNRYAHNNVNLGHILTGTGLKKVEVTKKNGFKTEAYLHSNGKTYMNAPWEETRGNYVAIVSGDKFKVLEDSYATAPSATDTADVIAAQDIEEADAEVAQFKLEVSHDDREALQEAERTLERGYKVDIPSEVAALKGADLEQQLRAMDMGDYVIQICEEFAGLQGSIAESASGTSLFISIMEKGNRSKIALKEITKAVFGVNDKTFMENYKETKHEAQTLRWIEHFMVQEKTDTMSEFEFDTKLNAALNSEEDRAVYDKYNGEVGRMFREYTPGAERNTINRPSSVQAVFSTRKIHKKFILGAHRLLKAVPLMKVAAYADSGVDRSLEKSSELSDVAEPAIAAIFPPDRGTPVTKAGMWSNITNRTGRNATMGNMGTQVVYEETRRFDGAEEYERMFSSLYAYNDIRNKVTSIEDGVEVVDLQLLAETLEMYRQQGSILMKDTTREGSDLGAETKRQARRNRRHTEGRRVMYPDEPITVETLQSMSVSPITIELIQHGMMVEKMKDYGSLKERVIATFPNDIGNQLEAISGQYELTPDELREIGDNIRIAQIAMIHFTKSEVQHLNAQGNIPENGRNGRPVNPIERNVGISKGFTVFEKNGNTIKLNMGLNYNWLVDEFVPKSAEQTFTFGLGPSYTKTFGKEERNHIGIAAGVAGPFPGEGNWGAAGSLSYTHDWGEYQRVSSGLSLTAGAPIGSGTPFMESLALVHANLTLLDVDQANVIARRADYEFRDMKESYEAKIALLDAKFDEEVGSIDNLSPTQLAQVKAQVFEHYKEDIIFSEIDDMSHIRFDKIGVSAFPHPPYFMIHLGVAFKSKTRMFYIKPNHIDVDALASQAIAQKAREAGGEGYEILDVSGDLVVTSEGERTYARDAGKAFDPFDDIDGANKDLMENQGVKIERVPGTGEFRLLPLQVDGLVEVYADQNEGIYAYPDPASGEFYFSIPPGTDLAIHRHTHVMPLPDGGVQEITKFYITDNPSKRPEQVAKSHTHHLEAYVSQRDGGRNSKAGERQHLLAEQVVQNYEDEILEWSTPDVLAAQSNLDTAFNSFNGYVGVERRRFTDMETAVKAQSSRIKSSISLKEATLSGSREAYARALMKEAQPLIDQLKIDPNNSAEMTAILQLVLIEDRSTAPTDPEKFIKHIEEWNRASIEQSLKASGVENADQIARKITSYYAVNMRLALENGEMPQTAIERSALVHTHIGYRPGGNVMEFMNGMQDTVSLEGAMVLDDALLQHHMHLDDNEVSELKRALTEQMAPIDFNNPDALFQHPIALQVLESGAVFFGPEYANALAEIQDVQDASALKGKQAEAYKAFSDVMKDLTKETGPGVKTAEYGGRRIRVRVDMQIGFINKCRNFTSTYRAERVQGVSGQADRTDDAVRAKAAARFSNLEAAAGMRVEEKEHEGNGGPDEDAESNQNHSDDEDGTMEEQYDGQEAELPDDGETGDDDDGF